MRACVYMCMQSHGVLQFPEFFQELDFAFVNVFFANAALCLCFKALKGLGPIGFSHFPQGTTT